MTFKADMAAMLCASIALATPAFGAARVCSPEPVEADAAIRRQWPELPATVRAALDGRDDLDSCARIRVRLDHASILLRVDLLDGRSAARAVSRKEDIVPTLVALLLVPEVETPAAESAAAGVETPSEAVPPAPASTTAGSATVTLDPPAAPRPGEGGPRPWATTAVLPSAPPPAPPEQARFRLEFSLATGGRVGDGYRGLAFGARTMFDVGGWLVGLEGAAAQYQRADQDPATSSLLLALLGGRRFRFEAPSTLSIDLAAGPALAVRGLGDRRAVYAQAGSSDNPTPPQEDDGPWARLVASAHVSFRARSVVRPFAGIDGEVALGTWAPAPTGAEPRLPPWIMGVVVGASVGTP